MTKNSNNKKAHAFKRAAAFITAALMAALVFTGCPHKPKEEPKPTTPKYKVTFAVEGGNGTIKAEADGKEINTGTEVEEGKTVTFTATANSNYELEKWTLDGKEENGTAPTYELKVAKEVTVKVFFKEKTATPKKHKVTLENTIGGNITVSPALPENGMAAENTELTFTATANSGYKFVKWQCNGTDSGTESVYKHKVTQAIQIKAVFAVDNPALITKHTVTVTSPVNGTVSSNPVIPSDKQVPDGTEITFTATANSGYKFVKWQCNGTDTGVTAAVYTHKVTQDVSITAVFKQDEPTGTGEKIFIEYDTDKISVWTKDADNNLKEIPSGTEVAAGTWFCFDFDEEKFPENEVLDKWFVNTKVLDGDVYTVNAADTIVKDGKKVITVTYTTRPAEQIKIKFDETKIKVFVLGNDGYFSSINTDTPVYERKQLSLEEKNLPEGQQVDKWKVNTKELDRRWYTIDPADAVTEGSNKVITVTYTLKPAEQIKIKFDETKIKVFVLGNDGYFSSINTGTPVYEGRSIWFDLLVSLPEGEQFDTWLVNTKDVFLNQYTVKAADASEEGGQKVIEVTYKTKPGVNPVTLKFDPTLVNVYPAKLANSLNFGATVYEGTNLSLCDRLPDGTEVDKWFINSTEHDNGYIYYVNPADYVTENGKKVLRIRFTVKNPQELTVQFNPAEIECKAVNGAEITPIGPGYKGPAYTYVILKAKVPSGKSVKHWKINGSIVHGSDGATELEGQANPTKADAGGVINISVVFE